MIVVTAVHRQRFDTGALAAHARACSGVPLRRAGALAELTLSGVHACLAGQPPLATALLWGSRAGIRQATARVLADLCVAAEPPLPFDFLATQPALAAVPVQQTFPCVVNALYQPWQQDEETHWARMLHLAAVWLAQGRYRRVLCGQVEPGESTQRGDWLALARADATAATAAPPDDGPTAAATLFDWLDTADGTAAPAIALAAAGLPTLRLIRVDRDIFLTPAQPAAQIHPAQTDIDHQRAPLHAPRNDPEPWSPC